MPESSSQTPRRAKRGPRTSKPPTSAGAMPREQVIKEPVLSLGIPKKKRQQRRQVRIPGVAPITRDLQRNAALYVAALLDPWSYRDIRVPDLLSWPTACTAFRTTISIATSATQYSQYAFSPNLGNTAVDTCAFAYRTAVASVFPAFTTNADSASNVATATNFSAYRTVAYGVRLIPTSALSSRAGLISAVRVQYISDLSTADISLSSNPNLVSVAANSDFQGFPQTWRPSNYVSGLAFTQPTATQFKGFLVYEFPPSTTVQTYTVEIIHLIEFIPKVTNAALFEVASAPGGEDHVATAWMQCEAAAGDPSGQINAGWTTSLASAAKDVLKEYGPRVAKQALRAGASYLAGDLASNVLARNPDPRSAAEAAGFVLTDCRR